jgi:septal ring factor EnvC (AmiA/AmiB activator)
MGSGNGYQVAISSGSSYFFYGQIYNVRVKPGGTVQKGAVIGELSAQRGDKSLLLFSVYKHGKEVNEESLLQESQ